MPDSPVTPPRPLGSFLPESGGTAPKFGLRGDLSTPISEIAEDSRKVGPGWLFVARRGRRFDGRAFVQDAIERGAAAVMTDDPEIASTIDVPCVLTEELPRLCAITAERFFGEPSSRLTLIGVTGTNGKSTVVHLCRSLLSGAGRKCGMVGTIEIDDGLGVRPATLTTPPSIEMSRTLATMVRSGCRAAAIEVSSHALTQDRVSGLRFGVGLFTNLTSEHLDEHGTMPRYAEAKSRLFAMLPGDGVAVVNADDPYMPQVAAPAECRVWQMSLRRDWGIHVKIASRSPLGMRLRMQGPWGVAHARIGLIGDHNAMNVLQAFAAAYAAGATPSDLTRALERATAPPGRLERVADGTPAVFVDYAHTPDALERVLATLRPICRGKLIAVFGCGGDRDRSKRPMMGEIGARLADVPIITSDNPRTEDPASIAGEVYGGVPDGERSRMRVVLDRAEAIATAIGEAGPDDVVLIAGKGHEDYQILRGEDGDEQRIAFDDRAHAFEALRRLRADPEITVRPGAMSPRPGGVSGQAPSP